MLAFCVILLRLVNGCPPCGNVPDNTCADLVEGKARVQRLGFILGPWYEPAGESDRSIWRVLKTRREIADHTAMSSVESVRFRYDLPRTCPDRRRESPTGIPKPDGFSESFKMQSAVESDLVYFLHIPKTSGTSLHQSLLRACGPEAVSPVSSGTISSTGRTNCPNSPGSSPAISVGSSRFG